MSYAGTVAADSPLLWFRCRESYGASLISSGSDNVPAFPTSRPGAQLGLTGIAIDGGAICTFESALMAAYTSTQLVASTGFSLETWVYVAPVGSVSGGSAVDLVVQVTFGGLASLQLGVTGLTWKAVLRDNNGAAHDVQGGSNLGPNRWHHLVGVQHAGTALKELWVDGVSQGTGTGNVIASAQYGVFTIRPGGTDGPPFVGEMAVYAHELSGSAIAAHHAAAELSGPPTQRNGLNGVCVT